MFQYIFILQILNAYLKLIVEETNDKLCGKFAFTIPTYLVTSWESERYEHELYLDVSNQLKKGCCFSYGFETFVMYSFCL